jgi:dienelactone hydrolase
MNSAGLTVGAIALALTLTVSGCGNSFSPGVASDAITGVLAGHTMNGQAIPCVALSDGVRVCQGDMNNGTDGADIRLASFDGVPLSIFVTLPPKPSSGTDGHYPLVVQNHGWGDPPTTIDDYQYGGPTAHQWAQDGYAVVQFAARGWGNSCGSSASRAVNASACANGYVHIDDYRFEARDVQNAAGLLVDEGIADPNRIGVHGESYGAGVSLQLATLKDRVMNADGTLSPWKSPKGTPLHIAAAAPFAGWSDLAYSLQPNGRTFDDKITSVTEDESPVGVAKLSILSGLYTVGTEGAYYALPHFDPQADMTTWYLNSISGEPYTSASLQEQVTQFFRFRSPYYMLAGAYEMEKKMPAPVFMANGFTDDIFPADEVLRYYNLAHSLYPSYEMSMLFFDVGHQRSQSKLTDLPVLPRSIKEFFDHYVKGTGPKPTIGVTTLTQTCPSTVPSGGPYTADTWAALHPGKVDYSSQPTQTILSFGGDPSVSQAFDPVAGGLACTTASGAEEGAGVASYSLPTPTGSGYTLLGSPTVTADLSVTGEFAYIAARLVDVDPKANTKTLVARSLYRIDSNAPNGRQTFQLHPNGWHFAPGHIPRLELLGRDAPYARPSNGTFSISVSNLELKLPVHEVPGAPGTSVEVE